MANAMDVYPPRDLPGRADDWGRRVEAVSEDLYKSQVQLQQTLNNGQRATAGQLALLSRQLKRVTENQEDLLGRVSYQAVSGGSVVGTFSPGVYDLSGLDLTVILDTPRVVKVTQFGNYFANKVVALTGANINGSRYFRTSFSESTVVGRPTVAESVVGNYSGIFSLPAGTHVIKPCLNVQGASGPLTVNGFSIVVDVLQKTV